MRKLFWVAGGLVVAIGLSMTAVSTAQAAPISPGVAASQAAPSLATPVHCRRYRHCHRRCWWRHGVRRCGSYCHRCG